jgi:hypothetical protein
LPGSVTFLATRATSRSAHSLQKVYRVPCWTRGRSLHGVWALSIWSLWNTALDIATWLTVNRRDSVVFARHDGQGPSGRFSFVLESSFGPTRVNSGPPWASRDRDGGFPLFFRVEAFSLFTSLSNVRLPKRGRCRWDRLVAASTSCQQVARDGDSDPWRENGHHRCSTRRSP